MYNAGAIYKTNMFTFDRQMSLRLDITLSNNAEISIYDSDIVENSFNIDMAAVDNNAFHFGSSFMTELNVTLINRKSDLALFAGAVVKPFVIAQISSNSPDTEEIPMGVYDVITAEVSDTDTNLRLKCYDFINRLNVKNHRGMCGQMYSVLLGCCTDCNIVFGMSADEVAAFPGTNVSYVIGAGALDSCRDTVEMCADIMCGFATMDRLGRLVIRKFGNETNKTVPLSFIETAALDNNEVKIKTLNFYSNPALTATNNNEVGITISYGTGNRMYCSLWNDEYSGRYEKQDVIDTAAAFVEPLSFKGAVLSLWGDPVLDLGDKLYIEGYGYIIIMSLYFTLHGLCKIGSYGCSKDSFSGTSKTGRDIISVATEQQDIHINILNIQNDISNIPAYMDTLRFSTVLYNSVYKVEMSGVLVESEITEDYECIAGETVLFGVQPVDGAGGYKYTVRINEDNNGWSTVVTESVMNIFSVTIAQTTGVYTVLEIQCTDIKGSSVTSYYRVKSVSQVENIPASAVSPTSALSLSGINISEPSVFSTFIGYQLQVVSDTSLLLNNVTFYAESDGIVTFYNIFAKRAAGDEGLDVAHTPIICKQNIRQGYNHISWSESLVFSSIPADLVAFVGAGISSTCDIHIITTGTNMILFSLENGKLVAQPVAPAEVQYLFKNVSIDINTQSGE